MFRNKFSIFSWQERVPTNRHMVPSESSGYLLSVHTKTNYERHYVNNNNNYYYNYDKNIKIFLVHSTKAYRVSGGAFPHIRYPQY